MQAGTMEQLALIYVEKNLQPGDSPEKAAELYTEADKAIKKYMGNRQSLNL